MTDVAASFSPFVLFFFTCDAVAVFFLGGRDGGAVARSSNGGGDL